MKEEEMGMGRMEVDFCRGGEKKEITLRVVWKLYLMTMLLIARKS